MFVHFTPEKNLKAILRSGITRLAKYTNYKDGYSNCIFAVPVTQNFYLSHQWLRELKRPTSKSPMVAIYFRIPDDTLVYVGRYFEVHSPMTAAQAVAKMMSYENHKGCGYEVIIPRKIAKHEIHHWSKLPQVIGWRYYPEAHGQKPCGCSDCQSGNYGGGKLRKAYKMRSCNKS